MRGHGARTRAAVVVWSSAAVIAGATGVAWSLLSREPNATSMVPTGQHDMPLARKGDYLIPRVKPPSGLVAMPVPLAPAVTTGGGLPNESLPSIEGSSPPLSNPLPSSASELSRAKATPHQRAHAYGRDVCAARGLRREDLYQDNHWRSWRCVK
jgi:hypothetical protein